MPCWHGSLWQCKRGIKPLYPGARIRLLATFCIIMQFSLSNQLSYSAISQLLNLLGILLPVPHKLPKSFYKFKAFFSQFSSDIKHQKACSSCHLSEEKCSCSQNNKSLGHLVTLSVLKPLQGILTSKHNYIHYNNIILFSLTPGVIS